MESLETLDGREVVTVTGTGRSSRSKVVKTEHRPGE